MKSIFASFYLFLFLGFIQLRQFLVPSLNEAFFDSTVLKVLQMWHDSALIASMLLVSIRAHLNLLYVSFWLKGRITNQSTHCRANRPVDAINLQSQINLEVFIEQHECFPHRHLYFLLLGIDHAMTFKWPNVLKGCFLRKSLSAVKGQLRRSRSYKTFQVICELVLAHAARCSSFWSNNFIVSFFLSQPLSRVWQ